MQRKSKLGVLKMQSKTFLVLFLIVVSCTFSNATYRLMDWDAVNPAFDTSLYQNVLDPAECETQLSHIQINPILRLQFLDAGLRIPRAILMGNTLDMGNYHGCLGIHQALDDTTVQGKYCMINIPANQEISLPEFPILSGFPEFSEGLKMNEGLMEEMKLFMETNAGLLTGKANDHSRTLFGNSSIEINFRMALCIPKSCTIQEGLSGLLFNLTFLGLQYEEEFCRLPNDKPWAPADYIAIIVFSTVGMITILSTLYDLLNKFILLKDPRSVNPLYTSFSVYTNARRLTTFTKNPGALECVDGIRALSMVWVIVGHTFVTLPPIINAIDAWNWQLSLRSIWITSAPLAVDTFFMMSGMLLVYTTAGKLTSSKLIQNLHLFYLNRILRMFPLLAAGILAQASFFHWISDGPLWESVAANTDTCRNYWWLNLLYVQNFFIPICLGHSWYLSIDMQLHILSPILLYFVLSNSKRQAWTALTAGLLVALTASTIYIFMKQLKGNIIQPARASEHPEFMYSYYLNSLTRSPPFFVGMLFGYILHLCRHKPKLTTSTVLLLWGLTISVGALSLYSPEPMKDVNYDNQALDSTVNAFARSTWALAVACLIVLCENGYGGPVNWLLTLQMWKLISRLSYAMYIFHYPIMFIITGTYVHHVYFTVMGATYAFFSQFVISFIVGFFTTLIIDSPFSTIFKQLLGGGPKKPETKKLPQNNNNADQEDPKRELKERTAAERNTENQ